MEQNYNTIINTFRQFANGHLNIERFEASFREQLPNFSTEDNSFPIMFAETSAITFYDNTDTNSFRIYVVDRLMKTRENEQEVLTSTLLTLRDLVNWFRMDGLVPFNVVNNPSATPVNNYLMDFTVGWYIDIQFDSTIAIAECTIPFNPDFTYTPKSC